MTSDLGRTNEPPTNCKSKPWWAEPRWRGARPNIEPGSPRAKAIAEKRRWERVRALLARCIAGDRVLEAHRAGELDVALFDNRVRFDELAFAIPTNARYELRGAHKRALLRLSAAVLTFGAAGVIASQKHIGELVQLGERQVRRVVAELVELEALPRPLPTFEPRGCVTSRRENAYVLTPAMMSVLWFARQDRARACPRTKNVLASGTVSDLRSSASGISSSTVAPDLGPNSRGGASTLQKCTDISGLHESPALAGPETAGATRDVAQQARYGGVAELAASLRAVVELHGDPDVRALLAELDRTHGGEP